MTILRRFLDRVPGVKHALRPLYNRLRGLPPVSDAEIDAALIRRCVGKSKPTLLEIGCNDGTHTLWLNDMFDEPDIYCFEPDPRAIERFKGIVHQRPNIRLFEVALSDQDGETTFYQSGGARNDSERERMPEGWDMSGSIRKPKEHLEVYPWVDFGSTITVPTRKLDSWRAETGTDIIDFIWMDVQGAEMDVFNGASESLKRIRYIYTEYSNRELYAGQSDLKEMLAFLSDFEVVVRYNCDILLKNKLLN